MTTQEFNLDLIPNGIAPIVHVSQYDEGQTWVFNIVKENQLYEIPAGSSITVQGTKQDDTGFQYPCTYSGSQVSVVETQQMTIFAGDVKAELVIVNGNNRIATLNFIIRIERAPLNEHTTISETDLPLIEEAAELAQHVDEVKGYMEMAEAYAAGTINGEPVPSTNPAYENSAKYYAEHFVGYVTDSQYTAISNLLS